MHILTKWEVEEFIEELQLRDTMWLGKDKLWVRRHHGENLFALKFINGQPHHMSAMYVKALHAEWPQERAERYSQWLLNKLSTYAWRKRTEEYLRLQLTPYNVPHEVIEEMARVLCAPQQDKQQDAELQSPILYAFAQEPPPAASNVVPITTPTTRSKYMQRLLNGGAK